MQINTGYQDLPAIKFIAKRKHKLNAHGKNWAFSIIGYTSFLYNCFLLLFLYCRNKHIDNILFSVFA